ncbi:MAG: glycosyltransferase, partial [Bacteroidia bacterium]
MEQSSPSKKIKILFLTRWYPNKTNIQLAVFIQKHAAAVARFCDVSVLNVTAVSEQKDTYEIVQTGQRGFVEVIVYYRAIKKFFSPLDRVLNLLRYLIAHNKGMNLIRNKFGKQDITHAYIFIRPAVMAWWMKIMNGIPYVISEQWSGYATGKFEKRSFIDKAITRFAARKAETITTVSDFLKTRMRQNKIEGNYHVIPNVIESNLVISNEKKDTVIKILTVADLVDEIKNISGTIKAIAEIVKSQPLIKFDIVGGGHDREKLEMLAKDLSVLNKNIFFHGMKTNEQVYEYLKECDFLIMNSRFETFSSICAEAMSCGKPVIATRCGGPEEFVIPETGMLISPDTPAELIAAIKN